MLLLLTLLGYGFMDAQATPPSEQATRHRRPPVLVEKGLLPDAQ
jgi:hypothetical protein